MLKDYEDRYCLFLDILGFRDIVAKSLQQPAQRGTHATSQVYFSLSSIAKTLKYKLAYLNAAGKKTISSRKVSQFSDSVVVSYRATEDGGLDNMLRDVLRLQLQLIHRKILVRGAITLGKLYHQRDFVFGPALNEAVELEGWANYPRVIADRDLLASASLVNVGSPPSAASPLTLDLDGQYFVDYFAVQPDDFDEDWGTLVEYLIDLREGILDLSKRREPSLRLKHGWMRQHFNRVVIPLEKSDYRDFNGHRVPEDEGDHIINVRRFR
jgi:hypothetical protein